MNQSSLMIATGLRVVLLILFIFIAKGAAHGSASVLQHYAVMVVLMLALSLSNGWYASVFMIRVPEGVANPRDKARASSMAVSLLVLAIAVGLWLAKLVHFKCTTDDCATPWDVPITLRVLSSSLRATI